MISIPGSRQKFCDGINRRSFLQIGGLGLGGATLADLLRMETRAAGGASHGISDKKAVIMIFLAGGIGHQDFVDLKPEAPEGIRGEFRPIPTNVPGIEICELMPNLAQMMDKVAVIRSIADSDGAHAATQCLSGYRRNDQSRLDQPSLGSMIAKELGPRVSGVPPFMGLTKDCGHKPWADIGFPGKLGRAYAPVRPDGEDIKAMTLQGVTLDQLEDRRRLLSAFDGFRRTVDNKVLNGADAIYEQAFDVLTSRRLIDALDIEKEDPAVRDRYGRGSSKNVNDGPPVWNDQILLCRRLVEVGVRFVTLGYGRWDYHSRNFEQMRERLPLLDQGLSALINDLHDRGMADDVSVVVCSEFGRTPKVNGNSGRDHWPRANCALLAGGGLRTGQVIGSTTADGGEPEQRPVKFQEIAATLYHAMGMDPQGFVRDDTDFPIKMLSENLPAMHELI